MTKSHFGIQHIKRIMVKRKPLKSHHALLNKKKIIEKTANFISKEEVKENEIKYSEQKINLDTGSGRRSLNNYQKLPRINSNLSEISLEYKNKPPDEWEIPNRGRNRTENFLNLGIEKINMIQDFEKIGHFKNYYPEFNVKELVIKKSRPEASPRNQIKSQRMKTKLQTYFFKKEQTMKTKNTKKLSKSQTIAKKNQVTSIFSESQSNENFFGRKQKINFFDLVYEVLTNEDLKKKLAAIKGGNLKKKKQQ